MAPVVVQQPDHFWQDMFLYQMMFGGPHYGYGYDYGSHPWLHPWHSYGIYRSRTIYRTTVIHNTTIHNTVKGSAFTSRSTVTAAKPGFWSRTGSLFKAGSARNTAAATAPRVTSNYKPSVTTTQSYRSTFASRALSAPAPRSSFSSGYRSGGFSGGGGFRSGRR